MAAAETSPSIQNEDLRTKMTPAQEPEPDPDCSEEKYSLGSMLFNVGLLSLCFGMGWAMFFAQVATTTVAAKQWASTAFGTVPYGKMRRNHSSLHSAKATMQSAAYNERTDIMLVTQRLVTITVLPEGCLKAVYSKFANRV